MCKKDFEKIADEMLCGVDYDIYKDDHNEMDNELRDEIESRLTSEFGCFSEMYDMLEILTESQNMEDAEHLLRENRLEILELLAKARGEHV